MGCISSRPEHTDIGNHSRIFKVCNVDDNGEKCNTGKIEVTDSNLILHRKGKEAIQWPLKCLRRYGWDAEIFSFESGRKCNTGSGIYAFKCKRAGILFQTVQDSIQRAGQQQSDLNGPQIMERPISSTIAANNIEGLHRNGFLTQQGVEAHLPSNSNPGAVSEQLNYVNFAPGDEESDEHAYINTGNANARSSQVENPVDTAAPERVLIDFLHNPNLQPTVQYIQIDSQPSTENLCEEPLGLSGDVERDGLPSEDIDDTMNTDVFDDPINEVGAQQPDYINVCPASASEVNGEHNYFNVDMAMGASAAPPLTNSHIVPVTKTLHYIEVKPNVISDSVRMPESRPPTSESASSSCKQNYTTIDFTKTEALSNSARNKKDIDEGSRKTRHNSTINT